MESISAIVVYNDNYNKKYSGREETLSAVSEDNLFEQFYKKNNQLKYCNGCYYEFKDKSIEVKYKKWRQELSHSRSFDLYYGGGVVD